MTESTESTEDTEREDYPNGYPHWMYFDLEDE